MPRLIARADALAQIEREGGAPPCLMCAIRERRVGATYAVYEDDQLLVLLPRYVRRWGHVVIMPNQHVTSYLEVTPALWTRVNDAALHAARMLERLRAPRKIYVASTGSSAGELLQSSMHLHVHVIPIFDSDDRPADIFSWQAGVYVADHGEWEALRGEYAEAWRSVPMIASSAAGEAR